MNLSWIKPSIMSILILVIFIFLFETVLWFGYKISGSVYLENFSETQMRGNGNSSLYPYKKITFVEDLNSADMKIAIFGGSSSAGYASPVSFTSLLKDTYGPKIVVHNYAKHGSPFVGFQSEILKTVRNYYDVIIIYAGHNELWSQLYSKARHSGDFNLPTGHIVEGSNIYRNLDFELYTIKQALKVFKWVHYIENSRIANLGRRIINNIFSYFNNDKKMQLTKLPFYLPKMIITKHEKTNIVENLNMSYPTLLLI